MTLRILQNEEANARLKATIQRSGKLGLTDATAKRLGFGEGSAVQFAEDDEEKGVYYLINKVSPDAENAYKVCKAGDYFYVNARGLFDRLGFDYEKYNIIFDLKRDQSYPDMEVWKMKQRISPRKKNPEE